MPPAPNSTLVEELLRDQQSLTAVESFTFVHSELTPHLPGQLYRQLLPASPPAPGQQYAFEVDLDRCTGCKACVTACHSLNGLEESEVWRSVGLLIDPSPPPNLLHQIPSPKSQISNLKSQISPTPPHLQHVTTACHHCADPACLNGCPVLAYHKDPDTGIVHHLDDQCIGCQYCVMKCPYDVPKYSPSLGIVRKCDLCRNRLAENEPPACAQACPNQAIRVALVDVAEVRSRLSPSPRFEPGLPQPTNPFLPGSPNPAITLPTTHFISARPLPPTLQPAPTGPVQPGNPHSPLVWMLVLTQCAAGLAFADAILGASSSALAATALAFLLAGLALGTLHLGQPLKAWRSFLGWRRSWLSRELLALGGFAAALTLSLLLRIQILAWSTAAAGLVGILASAMVYIDTHRAFWAASRVAPKFLLTSALACSWGLCCQLENPGLLLGLVPLITLAKCAFERRSLVPRHPAEECAIVRSSQLHRSTLERWTRGRLLCALLGGFAIPTLVLTSLAPWTLGTAAVSVAFSFAGECVERHLFFRAEAAPAMPGALKS